jgi:hypothetical protein
MNVTQIIHYLLQKTETHNFCLIYSSNSWDVVKLNQVYQWIKIPDHNETSSDIHFTTRSSLMNANDY